MPRVGKQMDEIIAQQLTDTALAKAIEKMVALANASVEPDTVAQVRSLAKKASAAAAPLAAHAKWVEEHDEANEQWSEVLPLCDSIFEDATHAAYITDAMEIDIVGPLEALAEALAALRTAGQ
jgi:sugar/nucleoside kinase (ribokinase family)